MPSDASLPPPLRLRRALLAGIVGAASVAGLGACADDSTQDIDEAPGDAESTGENVPLPPGEDTSTEEGPGGEVDGDRPGLGGDAEPDQGDFLED